MGEHLWIDTSVCAVEIWLTEEDIDSIKARHSDEEGFYVEVDDYNYYMAQARDFLAKNKINTYYLPRSLRVINFSNCYWVDRKKAGYFLFVLHEEGRKPVICDPIEIEQETLDYFGADKIASEKKLSRK